MRMWRSRGMWRRSRNGSRSARKRSNRRKNGRERKRNEGNERERGERGGKAKGEREMGGGETEARGGTGSGEGGDTITHRLRTKRRNIHALDSFDAFDRLISISTHRYS